MESHRISFRVSEEAVAAIAHFGASIGEDQSGFIRKAIEERLARMGKKVEAGVPKAGTYARKTKVKTGG